MTDTPTTPAAGATAPPADAAPHDGWFFGWVRGLGIVRANGWLGGVCGGIAARTGIDPLIVRGVFVVAALLGFPALLLYVAGWVLLPDLHRRIPLQQLGRTPLGPLAITIGIIALAVTGSGLLVWALHGGFFWFGLGGWPYPLTNGLASVMGVLFGVSFVIGLIVLVVWLVIRRPRLVSTRWADAASSTDTTTTDATTTTASFAAPAASDPSAPAATAHAEVSVTSVPSSAALDHPTDAPDPAGDWRARQDEWRARQAQWRRQQADADAAAREQARREREERGRAFAAEAQSRANWRRRTRPRTSALYVIGVLGAALVGGAITALETAHLDVVVAAGAALLVAGVACAVGMAVAGILRRRSGFLTFVACTFLLVGASVGFVGVVQPIGGYSISVTAGSAARTYTQLFGDNGITVSPSGRGGTAGRLTVMKGFGATTVFVWPGTAVTLDATLGAGTVTITKEPAGGGTVDNRQLVPQRTTADGDVYHWTYDNGVGGARATTSVPLRITVTRGDVSVFVEEGQ
jgi:phage shock protein PspC (stress-responsive transcriptional regulator)/uncharacterized membrane protein